MTRTWAWTWTWTNSINDQLAPSSDLNALLSANCVTPFGKGEDDKSLRPFLKANGCTYLTYHCAPFFLAAKRGRKLGEKQKHLIINHLLLILKDIQKEIMTCSWEPFSSQKTINLGVGPVCNILGLNFLQAISWPLRGTISFILCQKCTKLLLHMELYLNENIITLLFVHFRKQTRYLFRWDMKIISWSIHTPLDIREKTKFLL